MNLNQEYHMSAIGVGGIVTVMPAALKGNGPPSTNFRARLGQAYFDESVSPFQQYNYNGSTWVTGGDSPASTTVLGSVTLSSLAQLEAGTAPAGSVVPLANDVFTFVNSVVVAGGTSATTGAQGLVYLATNAQAVAGTSVNANTALVPSNLASVFAAPPAIGGTTPAAAAFTTLAASGAATLSSTLSVSGASTIAAYCVL